MTDPVRRAVRTFAQAFLGSLLTSGVLSAASTDGVVDWSALKKAGIAAIAGAVVAFLTFVQNVLEDNTSMPALLKAPASEGENPVPDPTPAKKAPAKKAAKKQAGQVSPGVLALVLVVALIVYLFVR